MDGDSTADRITLYESADYGSAQLYAATASGHSAVLDVSSSYRTYLLLAADADGDGSAEVFVDRNHPVVEGQLATYVVVVVWHDCGLRLVSNVDGETYRFVVGDLDGGVQGGGVGCVDADGDPALDLVGISFERQGETYRYERTVVNIDRVRATNGASESGTLSVKDEDAAALLSEVSCGEQEVEVSKNLGVTIEPAVGPPGTRVRVTARGCLGRLEFVAFTDRDDLDRGRAPTDEIPGREADGLVTAEFTVKESYAPGEGVVNIECASDAAAVKFTVTR